MKKTLTIIAIIIVILTINKNKTVVIPKESIRFRIIANSNSKKDQLIKKQILKNLKNEIYNIKANENIEYARKDIQKKIPEFNKKVNEILESSNTNYYINYGKNYFPRKEYKGIVYEEGEYESLIITLGTGKGENFWCVLFPPLCILDEFNNKEDVEYTTLAKEIIDKYF